MAISADSDQKPTDLDLHCLQRQRQGLSGFSRTRVKVKVKYYSMRLTTSGVPFIMAQGKAIILGKIFIFAPKHSLWVLIGINLLPLAILTILLAGLGGSVGCAVRQETRRSRVQPPPRSATFFRGD